MLERADAADEIVVMLVDAWVVRITDYRAMLTADGALLKAFNAECLQRGIVKGREKLYVSLAHTEPDVARTLETFEAALGALPRRAPVARA